MDKLIKIWDLKGRLIKSLSGHESTATVVCFHPYSKNIYSTSQDPYIMIWNKDYINKAIINCPKNSLIHMTPDGNHLIVLGRRKT